MLAAAVIAVAAFVWRAGWLRPAPNLTAQASYIDAGKCQACHGSIHRDYQHVGMARSFSPAAKASPIEDYEHNNHVFHAISGRHYQMLKRGGRIFQRRYELDSRGAEVNMFEQEATFAIGSGNHARTYLHQSAGGELTELPVTWYTQEGRWGMSPGYDNPAPPISRVSSMRAASSATTGIPRPTVRWPQGIDCQRCHGPGIAPCGTGLERPRAEEIRAAIVNPQAPESELPDGRVHAMPPGDHQRKIAGHDPPLQS